MIDVIIPLHNSQAFFDRLVETLANQSYRSFHVLFIDDQSDDVKDLDVLKNKIATKFSYEIHSLSSDISGPGSARNLGVKKSKSKYFTFLDSDDVWADNYLLSMIVAAEEYNSDVVEGMFKAVTEDLEVVSKSNLIAYLDVKDRLDSILEGNLPRLTWCKLYRREFICRQDISFPNDIHNGEDHVFLAKLYASNPTVTFVPKFLYFWIRRKDSLTGKSPDIKTIKDFVKVKELCWIYVDESKFNTLSRRLLKETRVLIRSIYQTSYQAEVLIPTLRQSLLDSPTLGKSIEHVYRTDFSYYYDVFIAEVNDDY